MQKFLLIITLVLLCGGCDQVYGVLDKEGAQEKKIVGDPMPLEPNPTVKEIQSLLKIYGYYPGKSDGTLGRRTRDALERFQKDNGLKLTRKADAETWKMLDAPCKAGLIVKGKINVQVLQTLLTQAGFNVGKSDGRMGPRTALALKQFQNAQGLDADGKIGYQTLVKLVQSTEHKAQSSKK
ncbi:MAG: peptidoglycan-binding protein [Candidatus Omnitrophica bacterium]|nr:peptidoglycan-binding protein [Candidatus Omnitrophota bacterium]